MIGFSDLNTYCEFLLVDKIQIKSRRNLPFVKHRLEKLRRASRSYQIYQM